MFRLLFVLFLGLFSQQSAAAPDSCYAGVYKTKDDLVNNRLSCKTDLSEKKNKLTFPLVADLKLEVKIVRNDSVFKFPRGSIFGYYQCGNTYRYSSSVRMYAVEDFYKIEETGDIIIYTSEFNGGSEYYYSVNLDSPIKRLNMNNLEEDYRRNPCFLQNARKLHKKGLKGGLARKDEKGHFMLNDIYRQTFP